MRGGESDPHVRIDARDLVQQVGEAQTSLLASVDGLEAPAEPGRLGAADLLLRRVPVAVYVLAQQRHLPHTLKNTTANTSARASTLSSTPSPPRCAQEFQEVTWSESMETSSRMELAGRLLSLPRVKGTMQ